MSPLYFVQEGFTPLMLAVFTGRIDVIHFLVENGGTVCDQDVVSALLYTICAMNQVNQG